MTIECKKRWKFLSNLARRRSCEREYTPEDQVIFLNVRYGESCRSKVVGEGQLIDRSGRNVAVQRNTSSQAIYSYLIKPVRELF